MCNHLNLKILIHIFAIMYLIMIIIIIRGGNFVAHLDGLCGTPVAHHSARTRTLNRVHGTRVEVDRYVVEFGAIQLQSTSNFPFG
jgi:hypothetical protein